MEKINSYVGLDVHKDTISVAVAVGGLPEEIRDYGKIANTLEAFRKLLQNPASKEKALRFRYEAGPCCMGISGD